MCVCGCVCVCVWVWVYIFLLLLSLSQVHPNKTASTQFEPLLLEHLQQHGDHQPIAHCLGSCLAALERKLNVMLQKSESKIQRQTKLNAALKPSDPPLS